ncbi:agmatinase, mitochondrial-like [Babylonia areolata]|uniref:agmatinase, mitochondrial-like n=1 Tax=Babylonia areolata TaxID=304850 RepID=UPI003FD3AA08
MNTAVLAKQVLQTWAQQSRRSFRVCAVLRKSKRNAPLSAQEMPRSGGIASMMRLPIQDTTEGLDVCFVGVPLDCGTSNRSGTRLGPRQIRQESCLLRASNYLLGATPFEDVQVADVGDVTMNIYDLPQAVTQITAAFSRLIATGCIPLTLGGDHTITFPILEAIKDKYGPVGLVHVDAHSDTGDNMLGAPIAHGTPFRRAVDSGCLDCQRVVQIGLRGSLHTLDNYQWGIDQGFRVVPAADCWGQSLKPLMKEVREMMGEGPVYISFDIDALDPSFAPGTGTPEIAGLTPVQAIEIIHGCAGLNIIGGDMVEVSPPYDFAGTTALTAANLLYEMLCVLPAVKRRNQV